jgi:signal peptidase I
LELLNLETGNSETSYIVDIELIKKLIESGRSIELRATGYSMFPTLMPGDNIILSPFTKGEEPKPGNIIVFAAGNILVIHRLVEIIENINYPTLFVTRGDSASKPDNPWRYDQRLGRAVLYKRKSRILKIKTIVPGKYRYKINRLLLWFYSRIKRQLFYSGN